MAVFYAGTLFIEGGNKCFELNKSYGFVHEQQFALQDDWNEEAAHQTLYRIAMEHDEPVEDNTKNET